MRQGAVDFFVKPVAPERLVISLRNAMKLEALETAIRTEQRASAPAPCRSATSPPAAPRWSG